MINCIVIDDQQGSIDVIVSHIKNKPELSLIKTFTNPIEAMLFVERNKVDLIFIDMEMPHLNGLDFIENLRTKSGIDIPKFVFTTGHNEYALSCFDQGVRDYLLKPVGFKRFNIAVDRIIIDMKEKTIETNVGNQFFFADVDGAKVKINFQETIFIESLGNYVKIIGDKTKVVIHKSLNSIQEIFPSKNFVRVHKSYIVSIPAIVSFKSNELTFNINDEIIKVPVGAKYKDELLKRLGINY